MSRGTTLIQACLRHRQTNFFIGITACHRRAVTESMKCFVPGSNSKGVDPDAFAAGFQPMSRLSESDLAQGPCPSHRILRTVQLLTHYSLVGLCASSRRLPARQSWHEWQVVKRLSKMLRIIGTSAGLSEAMCSTMLFGANVTSALTR